MSGPKRLFPEAYLGAVRVKKGRQAIVPLR